MINKKVFLTRYNHIISKLTAFKKFPTFSFNTRILSGTSFTANMIYVNNTA